MAYNFNLGGGLFDGVNLSNSIGLNGVNTNTTQPMLSNIGGNTGFNNIGSTSGWNTFSNVLGGIQGLAGAFTGLKQLGLAKKQFQWQKGAFDTNLLNQANMVNSQLERRAAADMGFKGSEADIKAYMDKFGAASSITEAQGRQKQQTNAWNKSQAMNKVSTGG
jgi:hypothetical protein